MHIDRFALGMRIPCENIKNDRKQCLELLLSSFKSTDISGISLLGGMVDDMYMLVMMGGDLRCMRKVYSAIKDNRTFYAMLATELPVIENNRLAKLPELELYGVLDENGRLRTGA